MASTSRKSNKQGAIYLLEILKKIPKQPKSISCGELHHALTAQGYTQSLRTLQRDLQVLCDAFGIMCDDRQTPYRYQWSAQSRGLSISQMNDQEALLLQLAYQHLKHFLPNSAKASLESLFMQAGYELYHRDAGDDHAKTWMKKVAIAPMAQPLLPPVILPEVLEAVSAALYDNRYLNITYANQAQRRHNFCSEYSVKPLALVQQGSNLYLVAQFDGFDDIRHLALHRCQTASVSSLTFEYPSEFDLSEYINQQAGFGFGRERICLEFCIDKIEGFHLTETPLSADQVIQAHDGYYHVRATVMDSDMLDRWLNGFGKSVWQVKKTVV
ncbi:hypothetical protein B0681_08280 [Moraxella porci DSM 25326]|uniref:WYL domain-containing protein n=1 Tax=Moraxella porci DSM 25326 TaxID=573983 RepID=A0A1T0CNW2_9GAMM|nr:WYL domain-containing protein [Moraxella porci]OOS23949.1 hypothetical protein B0681_08280 [Moraxella porci DSM 25326]